MRGIVGAILRRKNMTTLLIGLLLAMPAAAAEGPTPMPARFETGMVYVDPVTTDGKSIHFYTDSGGGLFLVDTAVKRLGLKTARATVDGEQHEYVNLPPFKPGKSVPSPLGNDGRIYIMPAEMAKKQWFNDDGMLGEAWFGGHVWTWNYPHERLVLEGSGWKPDAAATRVPLGFRTDKDGHRETNFARIAITVDGEAFDVLLDTGAMTKLTPEALAALGDNGPALRSTSMIVDERFKAWHAKHPDWRVIEAAQQDTKSAMIEVPAVTIAGATVGPVWFTWRPDKSFRDYMSGMMDGRVDGAIGGNALGHFEMTVDYPRGAGYFRCIADCKATPRPAP
jgi:hypothetical protein